MNWIYNRTPSINNGYRFYTEKHKFEILQQKKKNQLEKIIIGLSETLFKQ
jgi:DNA-binding transcriptional MerR regulator